MSDYPNQVQEVILNSDKATEHRRWAQTVQGTKYVKFTLNTYNDYSIDGVDGNNLDSETSWSAWSTLEANDWYTVYVGIHFPHFFLDTPHVMFKLPPIYKSDLPWTDTKIFLVYPAPATGETYALSFTPDHDDDSAIPNKGWSLDLLYTKSVRELMYILSEASNE